MSLVKDRKTYAAIQTFSPVEGKCNLTSGTHKGNTIRCVADGNVVYNFKTGGTETLAMVQGDDYAISPAVDNVTISSGTFHVS